MLSGTQHENSGSEALDSYLRSEDERDPRRRLLEQPERDCSPTPDDTVGLGYGDRRAAAAQQPLIGASAVRAEILSQPNSRP